MEYEQKFTLVAFSPERKGGGGAFLKKWLMVDPIGGWSEATSVISHKVRGCVGAMCGIQG